MAQAKKAQGKKKTAGGTHPVSSLDREQGLRFYQQMLRIRLFEEEVNPQNIKKVDLVVVEGAVPLVPMTLSKLVVEGAAERCRRSASWDR